VRIFGNSEVGDFFADISETITTDEDGAFTFTQLLDNFYRPIYDVTVTDEETGEIVAETQFTDAPNASVDNFSQCANDDGDGYAGNPGICNWTNGNLNGSNSVYQEEDATVQRLLLTGLANGSHVVTIEYDTTKGGKHAYDFLTDPDLTENWVTTADICSGLTNFASCAAATVNPSPNIPHDPLNTSGTVDTNQNIHIRNGSITAISVPTLISGSYAGDSTTRVNVTFTVNTANCLNGSGNGANAECPALLTWGAHVSSQADWGSNGSAVNISGSPYHVRVTALDGKATGNRDNQMSASVIPGTITIIKNATPDSAQDFSFTTAGTGLSNFSLDDDTDGTLPNTRTFVVDEGSYTVTEGVTAGWNLTNFSCVDVTANTVVNLANRQASINVAAGETVTCTFTNTLQQGTLTLVKTVTNDNGGTAATTDWTLSASGPTPISGTTGSGAVTSAAVNAGVYTLSESTGPAGYIAGSWGCTGATVNGNQVTVPAGGNVTCTINNNDDAPSLTLIKEVVNDNGGTAVAGDWTLAAAGYDAGSPDAGSYNLSESGGPAGYTQTSLTCDNVQGQVTSVTLGLGEDVTCTFVNNDNAPVLHLRKIVINDNGGSATLADFTLTANGTGANDISGTSPVDSGAGLDADTFALSETTQPGYTASAWSCVGGTQNGASITLGLGQEATCTVTNDDQQSYIIVDKTVINNNGGGATANDFLLTVNGNTVLDGVAYAVNPGVHKAGETLLSGYTASDWGTDCDADGDVTVALGQTKTCTITNDDQQAYVTLVKVVTNDNGGDAQPDDFDLTLEGSATLSGVQVPVNPGTYTAGETLLSGYTFEGYTGDCDSNGDVTVALGQSKSCTLTNNDQQAYITVTKIVNNNYGGTATLDAFALKLEGNAVNSGVQVPVNPGTYTASETLLTGYTFDGFSGSCDSNGDVTVALGESKSCTLTNSDIQPKLKLVKTVNNQYGGLAVADDFQASVGGNDVDWNVFVGLNAGNYDANETGLAGYEAGDWDGDCAADGTVALAIGETKTCTITNSDLPAEIHGMKFEDMNGNGVKDLGDNGLSGWTIFLDTNGDGDLDGGEPSTTTGGDGSYSFVGLSVGTYKVREVQQAGWTQTTTNPTDIVLENGEVANDVNFGNFKLVSITSKKFNDVDGDGAAKEASEPYLEGWTLRLYETSNPLWVLVDTEVTDVNGTVTFANLPKGNYKVCEVSQNGWLQTFPSTADNNTSPNTGVEGQKCVTRNVATSGSNPDTANLGNYEIKALEVSKTAATTYTRTHEWEISKKVDEDVVDLFTGDTQTVNYDVEVTKTGYTDSAWAVSGTITITNPNAPAALSASISDIVDNISDQGGATVTCPGGLNQVLAPGATLNCTYSKALTVGEDELNTVTVSTTGLVPGGEGTAPVDFGDPTTVVNDKINVDDTYEGSLGEVADTTLFVYDRPLTCGGQGGYTGLGNLVENTATITETNQSADEEVTVNCYDLTVAKTANTSYTKTWTWDIDKTSTTSTLNLAPGQIHPVYYEVTVSATSQNSDHTATGTITITNPAPILAPIDGVTDILTGNIAATVDCGGATNVPAEGELECTYEVDLANADALTNTAEVTMTNGTKYSGTAQVSFANATVNEVDESIDVVDDKYGALGTVLSSAAPKTFKYVQNVGPYESTVCGTTQKFDNTAELTTNDTNTTDSDTVTVDANIRCTCSLTQGYWKTHNDSFHGGAPTDDNWENITPNGELTGFFTLANSYPVLGPNPNTFTWYSVFWTAPKGNVYYNLAHQYMAAKLNVLNGAYNPTINADITQAEALLKLYTPAQIAAMKGKNATNISKTFNTLAGKFAAFNEGTTNPAGHCTETPR
jgi:hypothetical protein